MKARWRKRCGPNRKRWLQIEMAELRSAGRPKAAVPTWSVVLRIAES
jgi:hypothetical protein